MGWLEGLKFDSMAGMLDEKVGNRLKAYSSFSLSTMLKLLQ
jgi:hypothetical protein